MKLINYLLSESKKGWKWPNHFVKAVAMEGDRGVNFYFDYTCPPCLSETLISPHPFTSAEVVTREQYEATLAASKPEWDGQGLPPSGVEFEYLRGNFGADEGKWVRCTMKYAGDKFCIVHLEGEGESWLKHEGTKIRPIRSEADKKKEEAIKAIFDTLAQYDNLKGCHTYEGKADYMFSAIAAGKIPHIRID